MLVVHQSMLTHWTKKIIVDEGHSVPQLNHILNLVVRHFKVYYPVRHHLVPNIVHAIQRLGLSSTASIEHRRLAVDLSEVIIKWEIQRIKDEQDASQSDDAVVSSVTSGASGDASTVASVKRTASVDSPDPKRIKSPQSVGSSTSSGAPATPGSSSGASTSKGASSTSSIDVTKPIDKQHCDQVVNFLLRIACHSSDSSGGSASSSADAQSRRCVGLLKNALRVDVWPNSEPKLGFFEKILMSVESQQPNFGNIGTALELLCFVLGILVSLTSHFIISAAYDVIQVLVCLCLQRKEQALTAFKPLQRGIAACMTCPNSKVVRGVHGLLSRLMAMFPTESASSSVASKHDELDVLYACVSRVVYEGLSNYEKYVFLTNKPQQQQDRLIFSILVTLSSLQGHQVGRHRSCTERSSS